MVTDGIQQPYERLKVTFAVLALVVGGALGFAVGQFSNPLYIVVGIIGGGLFIASIFSIEIGLLVLFFLTYTRFSDIVVHYHNAPSIAKYYIFLMGIVVLIRWAVFRERPQGWQRAAVVIGILGLVRAISLLYASDTKVVSETLGDFVKDVFIAFIIIVMMNNGRRLRGVFWALLLAGIFVGTLSVYQYLTSSFGSDFGGFAQTGYMQYVGEKEGYRIFGPVGDPNFYAQVMVVLVPLALERLLDERRLLLRLAAAWALAVSGLTVVFTYSRGGFFALAAAVFAWFVIYRPSVKSIPIFILVGIALLFVIPKEYIARIAALTELISAPSVGFHTQDFSLRGRASETLAGLAMIRQHPFLGVGLGNYALHYMKYSKSIGLATSASARAAHDLYLEAAAETGLIGLAVFLLLLAAAGKDVIESWRKLKEKKRYELARMTAALAAALVGYFSAAVFVHSAYPRYFWLLLAMAFSMPNIVKNELEKAH
jgi:O-antigen ligase